MQVVAYPVAQLLQRWGHEGVEGSRTVLQADLLDRDHNLVEAHLVDLHTSHPAGKAHDKIAGLEAAVLDVADDREAKSNSLLAT